MVFIINFCQSEPRFNTMPDNIADHFTATVTMLQENRNKLPKTAMA